MSEDKWKDLGCTDPIASSIPLLDVVTHNLVKNTKTGETKKVYRRKDQSVGDAISKGQFVDET